MQTFLPYPDFKKSAQCLDYRRLGKQRVDSDGWYKFLVRRSDGKETKISHSRYHKLLNEGRIEGEGVE